jgi:hypothetical protein
MPASTQFTVKVQVINPGLLPELHARMADLEPAFRAIYGEWVDINKQKFELSKGMEQVGANVFGEFWAPLTPGTIKEKHPGGAPKRKKKSMNAQGYQEYPDWLMVRTGALMEAMSNPEALFQYFDKQKAIFGTPTDPDLADIVMWQAGDRQKNRYVVFLGDPDLNAIRRVLQDYFGMGGEFAEMRFAEGLSAIKRESEMKAMDMGFNLDAGGSD